MSQPKDDDISPTTSSSSNSNNNNTTGVINDEFIESVYQQMLAFATSQLADAQKAQDAVQDALVAALNHSDKFNGQATFKTWVFAILKNKIVDNIRKNNKYVQISQIIPDGEDNAQNDENFMQLLFDDAGYWHKDTLPTSFDNSWANPEAQAHSEGFWQVLEVCLKNLPADQSRVFLMKEYIELDTKEICDEVGISDKNYYVLMYRARLRLQKCLSIRWFEEQ